MLVVVAMAMAQEWRLCCGNGGVDRHGGASAGPAVLVVAQRRWGFVARWWWWCWRWWGWPNGGGDSTVEVKVVEAMVRWRLLRRAKAVAQRWWCLAGSPNDSMRNMHLRPENIGVQLGSFATPRRETIISNGRCTHATRRPRCHGLITELLPKGCQGSSSLLRLQAAQRLRLPI